jgi:DNA-binding transcriptional MerR regulator
MLINELNSMLGITKENIRYYEKEGLLSPARKTNGYRDYSEEDVQRLKKIVVLRKLGVPVAEIRGVLENRKALDAVLNETALKLEQEISDMQEARKICLDLESTHASIDEMDADLYLEKINEKNSSGFADLKKDVLDYSADLFVESFGHFQFFFPIFKPLLWKRKKKGSAALAVFMCMLFILGGGRTCWWMNLRNNMTPGHYWLRGMLVFALIVIVWLMLRNVFYFLSKKYPKAEKAATVGGAVFSALVSFGLVFLAVFHWGHLIMFRPYNDPPVFLDETAGQVQVIRFDEIAAEDNEWTSSEKSLNYCSTDAEYNLAVQKALYSCTPSGKWSVTGSCMDLLNNRRITGIPEEFWQILWTNDAGSRNTFFYLIHNGQYGSGGDAEDEWIVDEPNYGIHIASDELVRLVKEYDRHITIMPATRQTLAYVFEYDPERIWKDSMYKDGRFDTYHYLTLTDTETGEDVTDAFIEKYRDAWENEDWETILEAMKTVRTSWRTEYVNPEAAHMEGAG